MQYNMQIILNRTRKEKHLQNINQYYKNEHDDTAQMKIK